MDYEKEERIKRRKKDKRNRAILFRTMLIMVVLLTVVCILLLVFYQRERKKVLEKEKQSQEIEEQMVEGNLISKYEVNQLIKEAESKKELFILNKIKSMMEEGTSTLSLLENLFPQNIVVANNGSYQFFGINEKLEKNPYIFDALEYPVFNKDSGEYEGDVCLAEENEIHTRKGLDVSKFQEKVDWEKVAADGIEYAYIRLGYRGYESGKIVLDETFLDNAEGCSKAGIDMGVYFFTEAVSEREAIEEADFVLENLEEMKIDMPIVIDVEESASKDSRTKNLTREERTDIVKAFCNRIIDAGQEVMIYGNTKSFLIMMDIDELESYDKWFAYYKYPLRFPYKIKMWQYTAKGKVDGVKGGADINIEFY